MTRLYMLERRGTTHFDQTAAMVVRALSAKDARKIAAGEDSEPRVWLDPKRSSCVTLKQCGKRGLVIMDFVGAG